MKDSQLEKDTKLMMGYADRAPTCQECKYFRIVPIEGKAGSYFDRCAFLKGFDFRINTSGSCEKHTGRGK